MVPAIGGACTVQKKLDSELRSQRAMHWKWNKFSHWSHIEVVRYTTTIPILNSRLKLLDIRLRLIIKPGGTDSGIMCNFLSEELHALGLAFPKDLHLTSLGQHRKIHVDDLGVQIVQLGSLPRVALADLVHGRHSALMALLQPSALAMYLSTPLVSGWRVCSLC
jgi:hypothetical protein